MAREGEHRDTRKRRHPLDVPTYPIAHAARYIKIPASTLRSWVMGRRYETESGTTHWQPVIEIAGREQRLLSFRNMIEAFVLDAVRRQHRVQLPKVRAAISYMRRELGLEHPLAHEKMETDGCGLFVRQYGRLINVSEGGQHTMEEVLRAHLRRIEWARKGPALRLYPLSRRNDPNAPMTVVIDPLVGFGRPVITGTGIRTQILVERWRAGDSFTALARDYRRPREEIEEAIRYECQIAA